MERYRIIGRGGLHDVILEVLREAYLYDGYYDNKQGTTSFYKGNFSSVNFDEVTHFILGFASIKNMLRRELLFSQYIASGAKPVNAISAKSHLFSTVVIGQGNVICPFAQLGANVNLGSNCIVFSNSTVEHDSKLGNNVNIAPGVSIAGGCRVGNNVFIGIGSVIKDHVHIGDNVVVGAGSLVLQDIPDNVVVYGSPAKPTGKKHLYEKPV